MYYGQHFLTCYHHIHAKHSDEQHPCGRTFASGNVASERMTELCSPGPCGINWRASMHCTYLPSSPGSPPWQRSLGCSLISAPAQPYSSLNQNLVSSFSSLSLFLPLFRSLYSLFLLDFLSVSYTQPTLPLIFILCCNSSCCILFYARMKTHGCALPSSISIRPDYI